MEAESGNAYQRAKARRWMSPTDRAVDRAEARRQALESGQIYFIECAGFVKVGYSMEPRRRVMTLQAMIPLPCRLLGTIPGGTVREAEIHADLASHLHRGEWFKLNADVLRVLGGLGIEVTRA